MRIFWRERTSLRINPRTSRFNECSAEKAQDQIGFGTIYFAKESGLGTRQLAVPGVRIPQQSASSSFETEKQARWRHNDKLDYTVRHLPRKETRELTLDMHEGVEKIAGTSKPVVVHCLVRKSLNHLEWCSCSRCSKPTSPSSRFGAGSRPCHSLQSHKWRTIRRNNIQWE